MEALVSIVMPSYNSEAFIAQSIDSVLSQTYTNWELIIVDDCSVDQTVNVIQSFSDIRIKLHRLDKNSGAGIARNTAVSLARGRYIAFLDSDDLWRPEKLQKQLDFMRVNHLKFTFSFYDCIDENGNALGKRVTAPDKLTYNLLFFSNFVGNLTGIYDVNFFGKIEIAAIRKRQDWILWLTILRQIKVAIPVTESLAFYRIRQDSISASKWKLLSHNYAVYRNFHGFNPFVSLLCMVGFLFTQFAIKRAFIKKI